jgi:Thioesterase-like superfamily
VTHFYERRDGLYHPTAATIGPWDPKLQHGGPGAALLGSLLEAHEARPGTRLASLSFDILGPIPAAPMRIDTRTVRGGKKIALSEAVATVGDRAVLRASAWRLEVGTDRNPDANLSSPVPPMPAEAATTLFPEVPEFGYGRALEWRFVRGSFATKGPATLWARLRAQVIRGQEPSPLARVLAMVDSANGVSREIDMSAYLFVPVNLTVSLTRAPDGEWTAMAAETSLASEGTGTTRAELFDLQGPIGLAVQTLYVEKRG